MSEETRTHNASPSSADGGDSRRGSYNTVRPEARPRQSFRTRLTLFFALTAVMTAVVLSIVLALTWENQFQSYARENMNRLAQSMAEALSIQYEQEGRWTEDMLTYATSTTAFTADLAVQVLDARGNVLYDDTWAQKGAMGTTAPDTASTDPQLVSYPKDPNSVVEASIVVRGRTVGTVRLWAFESEAMLTKSDAAFRANSYSAILGAAGVAVILACVIGYFASKALARPIKVITSTARQIRSGDLTARTGLRGDDEIGQLGETFDSMATTLEQDIKIEHRLTSDVAHELRTPLMAMLATVEAMQDGVLPADDEHFETVASETRRLSRLVDAMLHLSRMESGKAQLKTEPTDMIFLVHSLVSSQHQLFHERGIHLRFIDETGRDECYAEVDADLIREAIVNLMSNALRYTPDGGWVIVRIAYERPDVLVSVQDTGIGIAKEDIPQVFSRFWRSEASRERARGGLGVGLAITKQIVDAHNGTINVESELGKGTTFTLRIPNDAGRRERAKRA